MRALIPRLLPLAAALLAAAAPRAAELELYGTFECMGVIVTASAADGVPADAVAVLDYRRTGDPVFREGQPPARVAADRWTGSLFGLAPGTAYQVRVEFVSAGGGGPVLLGEGATRAEPVAPAPLRRLFTSPDGSGDVCSEGQPCALEQALADARPGDEIVLAGGTYPVGGLSLPRSGTAQAPIVLRAAAGAVPVLDADDPAARTWTAVGGGVYRTAVAAPDPHVVHAQGVRLFPYASLAELQGLIHGVPGFYADGTDLWVRLARDADPNPMRMEISRFNVGLNLQDRSHVWVEGLTFRHYGRGAFAKAVYLDGASDVVIRRCAFEGNDVGVGLRHAAHRNVIDSCTFFDSIADWPWQAVKEAGGLEDGGVVVYAPLDGRGNVIRRNVFHDDFDGLVIGPATGAALTHETDVYHNLIFNMGDDGLAVDGLARNVRLWGNEIHDVLTGISLAPAVDGPTYALRNVIHRLGSGRSEFQGTAFKLHSGGDPSGPMLLFHNTVDAYHVGHPAVAVFQPGAWAGVTARNNIWSGTAYALVNTNAAQPMDLDHDDLWTGGVGHLVQWDDVNYDSVVDFHAGTGQEAAGLAVDPRFVNPSAGNYALAGDSGLIDAGVLLPGINDDHAGPAPDLGALEHDVVGSVEPQPVLVDAPLRAWPNPFRDGTRLSWSLAQPGRVELAVYDLAGRRVATLLSEARPAGEGVMTWDGRDRRGRPTGAGVYFVRLREPGRTSTVRLIRID
ncbi:MAG TPA: right-handed parallel beta-helix repeat-containing protein [Candidatus Krumholzibacteria bacterium]|nr:right-handed parallel beta-helix repeat-containing protein [Candidatus Krumholzibacteria bacterium]